MTKVTVEAQNLTRNCNEALILASLATGPKHGYQLALDIEERGAGLFKFNHGTLYPILHKLEKEGLIRGTWSDDGQRRKRKSYTLTDSGRSYAREQLTSWRTFYDRFFSIVGDVSR
jgi:DNA-binding PadR family transcriptional regulator